MLNIVANYIGTAVNTVVPFVAIPFYVNLLGERAWGLVSTIFLIQSVLSFSEAGVGQISSIAFSRIKPEDNNSTESIKEYESVYWINAFTIWLATIISSSLFAWLGLFKKYTREEFLIVAFGASFIFLAQFPGAVYRSVLMHTKRQVEYNKISILFTLFRHSTTIVSLHANPSLYVFLIATFSVTMLETIIRRQVAMQVANKIYNQITVARLKHLYFQSLGPAATVIIGMLTTQLDKILGAAILNPAEYGHYALASMLAQGCITLTQPIIQAISPIILQHRTPSPNRSMASRKMLTYLLLTNIFILLSYWAFGRDAIELWLQSSTATESVQLYLNVLIWGAVLNSLYHANYFRLLSEERFKRIFWINIFGLVASAATTPILVRALGEHWIGFAFVIPNLIAILATTVRPTSK